MRDQHNKLTLMCRQCRMTYQKWPAQAGPYCSRACASAALVVPLEDRFWQQVSKADEGCWLWMGGRSPRGYGKVSGVLFDRPRRHYRAHRVAYELTYGPIADEAIVRHFICDNPPCCRPDHLKIGTTADNVADRVVAGRSATGDNHWTRRHPTSIQRGERNPRAVLTESDVRAIRHLVEAGHTKASIGRQFGVSAQTVRRIHERIAWGHVM